MRQPSGASSSARTASCTSHVLTSPERVVAHCQRVASVADNKMTFFPTQLTALTLLQRLNLSNDSMSEIPHEVGRVQMLREMRATDYNITVSRRNRDDVGLLSDMTSELQRMYIQGRTMAPMH